MKRKDNKLSSIIKYDTITKKMQDKIKPLPRSPLGLFSIAIMDTAQAIHPSIRSSLVNWSQVAMKLAAESTVGSRFSRFIGVSGFEWEAQNKH